MTSQNKESHLDQNFLDRNFLTQLDDSEMELVRGGANVDANFKLDNYLFVIGAGTPFTALPPIVVNTSLLSNL